MFSKKSIKNRFILQLAVASATLIAIFSIILYNYIKISIYQDLTQELAKEAAYIAKSASAKSWKHSIDFFTLNKKYANLKISIVIIVDKGVSGTYRQYKKRGEYFLEYFYPYDEKKSTYLKITKNITNTKKLLGKILRNILIINFIMLFFVIFYALFLSQMITFPIKTLSNKLAKMNENFLTQIDIDSLPLEFVPLGNSINKLTSRIQNFVKYQKELFIGVAHELKTPLAVMKTKNEVTLLKKRDAEKYIEALKLNNKTIDNMNKMISNILEIGRQEGAQFELPVELDLIKFLKEHSSNFKMLASLENKHIKTDFKPDTLVLLIQPTLLTHILQNFVQNAIKFTNEGGTVKILSFIKDDTFVIKVIDEGIGIDENKDLFAPFKRYGEKSGAGLGLFLAKAAADAIGAKISIKNRLDRSGAIALIEIPAKNHCEIPSI